jgi:exopolyphosphatase/guanosine-5'-triphosphate,3'-diphosphate pyrophosphatase
MNIAIIDLGTNTFNLLVVQVAEDKSYDILYQNKIPVKLGEGGITNNYIEPIPFQRGIDALEKHLSEIKKYNCEKIAAFATSAIREASNGNDFVLQAKQKLNLTINVISGDKEAELIYYGVRQAVQMDEQKKSLIIDIGGGSTEFIIANKNKIFWKQSFLLGAARLLEKFNPSDPMTDAEIESIKNYLFSELKPLFEAVKKHEITELIGSSGSFDSLAEMIAHKFYSPAILDNKTEYDFKLDDCIAIYESLIKSTKAERMQMKGLVHMRVDMMVISAILVHFVVAEFEIKKMRLSTYSLKEGVLYELFNS